MSINPKIVGILNVTPDSFSDGGEFFSPKGGDASGWDTDKAVGHALEMVKNGADIIDVGAESTHPDSRKISADEEIKILDPVVRRLKEQGVTVSIDTYKPEVMKHGLELGADMINDVTGLKDSKAIELLAGYEVPIVIMYSRSKEAHAEKREGNVTVIIAEIKRFFDEKINQCVKAGISKERLILDPGMGFFLGANPEPSLMVLKHLKEFKDLGCRTYISTSRKSFIGSVTGAGVTERGAGTLATELWAALQKVDYIRTHDVKQLADGLKIISAISKKNNS